MKYLDPKSDFLFKRLFAENPALLIDLLNSILPLEESIFKIEYLTNELVPHQVNSKLSTVDVPCVDTRGRHFFVEMQMTFQPFLHKRMIYSASKVISRQLVKRKQYDDIGTVYAVCFVDEDAERGIDDWFHHYVVTNKKYSDRQMHGVEWFFIELGKWKKNVNFRNKEKQSLWLTFLTEPAKILEMMSPTELAKFNEICDALDIVKASNYTEAQINGMEKYLDEVRSYNSGMAYAEKKGLEKGIEKGMKKGLKKGIDIALMIVLDLKSGIPISEIADKYKISESMVLNFKTN
jgi:predicted transposase/invertase (TIGR01784 family)